MQSEDTGRQQSSNRFSTLNNSRSNDLPSNSGTIDDHIEYQKNRLSKKIENYTDVLPVILNHYENVKKINANLKMEIYKVN